MFKELHATEAVDAKYELIDRGGYIPTGYKFDPVMFAPTGSCDGSYWIPYQALDTVKFNYCSQMARFEKKN